MTKIISLEELRSNKPEYTSYKGAFLMTLFSYGELVKDKDKQYDGLFGTNTLSLNRSGTFPSLCKKICEEIVYHKWSFISENLNYIIRAISGFSYFNSKTSEWFDLLAEGVAYCIAEFCANNNIIWDDTNISQEELDECKTTYLGDALFKAGCFLNNKPQYASQPTASAQQAATNTGAINQTANQTAQAAPAATAQASAPTVSNQGTATNSQAPATKKAPANGYKSSGGHSQDIPNLIGNAGQKVYLSGPVYCIIADKIGKNTPRAFITPLIATSIGGVKTVSQEAAEKVKFGSGNGYTDCTLFFESVAAADKALDFCKKRFGVKYTNISKVTQKADGKGYFKVSTEIGEAFIKASVLNEELEEKLTEGVNIKDIDIYSEWMQKSIS